MSQEMAKLIDIFWKSVRRIQVPHLIREHFIYDKKADVLNIFDYQHDLKNKDVYLVGAGKAAFQMAIEVEKVLGTRLKSGLASVPIGTIDRDQINPDSVVEFYEGAENNLPDELAEMTTKKIMKLAEKLDEKCLLLVLLSGGGSALLTAPLPPVTLKEKCAVIDNLAKAGADIIELNRVRKRISAIKGGRLCCLAYPAEVATLMLVDIPQHRPQFVASGPTMEEDKDNPTIVKDIIEKYSLVDALPHSVKNILDDVETYSKYPLDMTVSNYILANNLMAVNEAKRAATESGFSSQELGDSVQGNVERLSEQYCRLVCAVIRHLSGEIEADELRETLDSLDCVNVQRDCIEKIVKADIETSERGLCLVAGGEPTVTVRGAGRGGRSQQLALSFSLEYHLAKKRLNVLKNFESHILCAGTDGMDGPTDAAGAIGYDDLVSDAADQNLDVEMYLDNNDSYNFYSKFHNGKFHIKTGHTNTNLMDLHIILIKLKSSR